MLQVPANDPMFSVFAGKRSGHGRHCIYHYYLIFMKLLQADNIPAKKVIINISLITGRFYLFIKSETTYTPEINQSLTPPDLIFTIHKHEI